MNTVAQWNESLKADLAAVLKSSKRPQKTMTFDFLDGFVRAMACAPNPSSPFNWSQYIFGHESPNFEGKDEAGRFYMPLFALYNQHIKEALNTECHIPETGLYHSDKKHRNKIEHWAQGFLYGYSCMKEQWLALSETYPEAVIETDLTLEPLPQQLESLVYCISVVADCESSINSGTDAGDVEGIFDTLHECVVLFGLIGSALRQAEDNDPDNYEPDDPRLFDHEMEDEFLGDEGFKQPELRINPNKNIGRNDPCPCGSGKKFKKCCLN